MIYEDTIFNYGKYKGRTASDIVFHYNDLEYLFFINKNKFEKIDKSFKIKIYKFFGAYKTKQQRQRMINIWASDIYYSDDLKLSYDNHTMRFGKYKGFSIKEIRQKDPSYNKWLLHNKIYPYNQDNFKK